MVNIKIILGSTRPGRFGEQPANWLLDTSANVEGGSFELIDLKEVNLPFLDESTPPSQNKYANEHTKKWSRTIGEADGFIIVTAEYNHSVPAALKNAIDFLFKEWHYKPVSFVSYGSLAGGARAVEHLRGVAGEVRLYDLREQLLLPNYWDELDTSGQYKFTDAQTAEAKAILEQTIFWAEKLKPIREELLG